MFRLIRSLLAFLICPLRGIVLLKDGILKLWVYLAGSECLKLPAMLILVHIIRTFTLFLLPLLVVGSLTTLGGSGVGSWPRAMNLSCLSIFALWTAPSRLLRRYLSMSLKILTLPGRLGFLSFPSCIRRLAMSVVFLLLAVGVTLAGLWVLSIQIKIV